MSNQTQSGPEAESVNGLLDGATPQVPPIGPELSDQRRAAADPLLPVGDRLEAFEDIIDS